MRRNPSIVMAVENGGSSIDAGTDHNTVSVNLLKEKRLHSCEAMGFTADRFAMTPCLTFRPLSP